MNLANLINPHHELADPLPTEATAQAASRLGSLAALDVYPQSLASAQGALLALGQRGAEKWLVLLVDVDVEAWNQRIRGQAPICRLSGHADAVMVDGNAMTVIVCPTHAANAACVRDALPYTRPRTLGLATSAGCGDRLGLATPGHIQALRGTGIAPILAQQSMRENARTGRTPQQVIDDATWGVFQEGWRMGYGADADHLKTPEDVDRCVAAGYTFFTVDPGAYVQGEADSASAARLGELVHDLPWAHLDLTAEGLIDLYAGKRFQIEPGFSVEFSEETLMRAAAKYGGAIAHTARMFRHLAAQHDDFELEMSVDETETVTTPAEHFFVASELRRLGVRWVSLAPRYLGRFEKGVDYIGDLAALAASLAQHAAIARALGPYKLSIHSGSDKFSAYPAFARHTAGLVHLKTAGTSYLEALRAAAQVHPGLFRRILALALERYAVDRATYHVSASAAEAPDAAQLSDAELPGLLDHFHARQVLHVTFGSVLDAFGDELKQLLRWHEAEHYAALRAHFHKHLQPFSQASVTSGQ